MSDEDLVRRGDVLTEVAKMWKWSVLAAAELEEAVNQIPSAQPSPDVAALVEARIAEIEAVEAYNSKLERVKRKRGNGDWTDGVEVEYRAMCDAQSVFIRAAAAFADATLARVKGGAA